MKRRREPKLSKELLAELLKERIYATLALLAVLISVDTGHDSVGHTALLVFGTIISLWLASLVATIMARRVVYQQGLDHEADREHQLRKHAPMLSALGFPGLLLLAAGLHLISLNTAINLSIASALLLLISWSIISARSLRASGPSTLLLAGVELLLGLAVVSLKVFIGH